MTTTQVLLPGQTFVAEGPHDQTGMYLMHHAFRRDLARFESAVRNTPVGDDGVWRALAARWDRFAEVLHHHHTIEDTAIWPVLLDGVRGDTEDTATLHAMEAEHAHVDPALAACRDAFAAMASHPCDDHRNALDVHVTAVRTLLADHLRHEETEALPMVQRVMTDEQFAASEAATAQGYPTRMVPFLVPWVCDEVPGVVATRFLAQAGAVYALLLRVLRRGYARREKRAFRYA
ncbi:hemerythrin domain-containing protein [Pseudonocardia tropica]|uniref:Hemerythrin domain-containing protein n=1 Tax=Pseudonocardia tropica TaxID=681289 RepID=A0ABV1K223_9PSEU